MGPEPKVAQRSSSPSFRPRNGHLGSVGGGQPEQRRAGLPIKKIERCKLGHSPRSASIGSTRAARLAGTQQAASITNTISTEIADKLAKPCPAMPAR